MRHLPMDLLRAFATVAELGSVTRSSDRLGRTQPAISLQIKRLEQGLDRQLFLREGSKLTLTSDGKRLLGYAQRILALNEEAIAELTQPVIQGRICLGIPSEFATTVLPKVLSRFSSAYPQVSLDVTCDLSRNLLAEPTDRYDLLLALREPKKRDAASLVVLDELVWVSRSGQAFEPVQRVPLVIGPEPCLYRSRAQRVLKKGKVPYDIVYSNPDLSGIITAIDSGLGVTVLARRTVPESLQIIRPNHTLPKLGQIGIHLIRPSNVRSEPVELMAEAIQRSL